MRSAFLLTALILLVATACGGGSGDDSDVIGGNSGSSNLSGAFTPDDGTPGPDSVAMAAGNGGSGDLVDVRVDVVDANGVYAASFDVAYDPAATTFRNWTAGSMLEAGGASVTYQVSAATPGRLVVGVSRTGGASGTDASGAEPLIHLFFRVRRPGTSTLSFQNANLLDGQSPPRDKPGISWSGGTLTAN